MITQQLTPLETLIDGAVTYAAFADAARAAFSGKSGEDVLSALTAVAHPLFPPEGRTPEAVAREIGRREVVALLLRASGNISPTPSHARRTSLTTTGPADQPQQPAAPAPEDSASATIADAIRAERALRAALAKCAADDRPAVAYPDGADPYADADPAPDHAGSD
jgi:hypothetical protein